jgi:hypothetical protein
MKINLQAVYYCEESVCKKVNSIATEIHVESVLLSPFDPFDPLHHQKLSRTITEYKNIVKVTSKDGELCTRICVVIL